MDLFLGSLKIILALTGGIFIVSYLTGNNMVQSIGLQFDKQLSIGVVSMLISIAIHVLLGGRL